MAVLSSAQTTTLVDIASVMDPQGRVAKVAELFQQMNPVLEDMNWIEGNLPTGHRIFARTGMPTVYERGIGEGVVGSKSTFAPSDEQCAILEAISEVDIDAAKINGNTNEYRLLQAKGFMESMNQRQAQLLFYGNVATNVKAYTGLTPRYNSLSGTTSQNVISAGSVSGGDGASIWIVVWGPDTVTGIYPKGSQAGLFHENLGEQLIQTGTGIGTGRLKAFVDRYQWKCGLAVPNWQYAARLCNIDVSAVVADTSGATIKLIEGMIRLTHRIPNLQAGRAVFYCSRSVRAALDVQALNKTSSQLTLENIGGKLITTFRGIPLKTCDQLLETEATVS